MSSAIPTTREFIPDFSGTSPYSSEYQFDSVVFPTNAPLLAQDINESQSVLNDALKLLVGSLLTNGIIDTGVNWWSPEGVSVADGDVLLVSAFGKMLYIKGPVSIESKSVWCRFRKQIITAESGDIDGLENYLANNAFGIELSRRVKYVFDGLHASHIDDENYLSVKILDYQVPVYARVKIDSAQGDTIGENLQTVTNNLDRDLTLLFNDFNSTTVTEDVTDEGYERITETQHDIDGSLRATKVSVFNSDYTVITETLTIEGDKTYIKETTFSVDENGNDVINSKYTIVE